MKVLTIIFCIHLLTLSLMPCGDAEDCKFNGSAQAFTNPSDHSDHDGDTENCSPFCMCACCGHSISIFFHTTTLQNMSIADVKEFPLYNTSPFSEVFLSIWQPPKIA